MLNLKKTAIAPFLSLRVRELSWPVAITKTNTCLQLPLNSSVSVFPSLWFPFIASPIPFFFPSATHLLGGVADECLMMAVPSRNPWVSAARCSHSFPPPPTIDKKLVWSFRLDHWQQAMKILIPTHFGTWPLSANLSVWWPPMVAVPKLTCS